MVRSIAILLFLVPMAALAQDPLPPEEALESAFPARDQYSPYAGRNFPTRA